MSHSFLQALLRKKSIHAEVHGAHGGGELKRSLGLFSLVMLGVGATIGTGIFFAMGEAVPKAGPAVIWAFVIAGVAAGLTALCYAELASCIPASGSAYSYTYVTNGEFAAYVVGSCLFLEYALAASATAIGWSEYLNNFLQHALGLSIPIEWRSPMLVSGPNGNEWHWGRINLPPIVLIGMCCTLLLRGAQESATVNAIMVLIKIGILIFFSVVAFTAFSTDNFVPFSPHGMFGQRGEKGAGIVAAAGTIFFSFIGLDTVATAGAETENPRRNVPLGIMLALGIVVLSYIAVATAAMGAQPVSAFLHQEAGLSAILEKVTGKQWPSLLLSAGAIISVFSVTLVLIYGQTRILFVISRDGLIPKVFQNVHPRTLSPVANTVIVSIIVAAIAGLVDSSYLWDMVSMGTLVAFSLVSIGVTILRYRSPEIVRGFRLPFGPWLIPSLSVISCLWIVVGLSSVTYMVFGVWIAMTVAAYLLYGMGNSKLADRE
jgi:APA family basic amino acid/polyamine antiporter